MPSTLPLSVTGSGAALRPARRRSPRPLLPLALAALLGWLPPAGGIKAEAAAAIPAASPASHAAAPTSPSPSSPGPRLTRPPVAPGSSQPRVAPVPQAGTPAAPALSTGPAAPAPPIHEADFQLLLRTADLDRLNLLCNQLSEAGDDIRLRRLRERLLTIHPAPQPLPVVLANAEVLLSCRMPAGALTVLDRIGPARGAEQIQWLTLQWRAANAALDHHRAALALERLAAERPARLETLQLPLLPRPDGSWASRSALDVLASHLESAGQSRSAAGLLQLSRDQDAAAAERLAQAARLLADLPPQLREPVFERALEQAAAAGSWGLVGDLLAAQAALPASPEAAARTAERRMRLSRRLDDAYSEWRALQDAGDPTSEQRRQALGLQLRSPLIPGGHAETLPAPSPLPPLSSVDPAGSGSAPPAAAPAADVAPGAGSPRALHPPTGSAVPPQP